jgi:small subunit ribosomal protein S17
MAANILHGYISRLIDEKTVKVTIYVSYKHPTYKKVVKRKKNFLCHNLLSDLQKGDKVSIQETRPYSKLKTWKVLQKESL